MADKNKGWVLVHRSIRENWIWDQKPFSLGQAWIDLLLDVNHEDNKFFINGKLITVKRGQKWTSLRVLSERWGWRQEKVLRYLKALESDGMITRSATPNGTLLTLVNYGKFQDARSAERSANGAQSGARTERKRSETKNDKRMNKEGKKERQLPSEEKTQPDEEEDTSWFDSLEDENDTTEN